MFANNTPDYRFNRSFPPCGDSLIPRTVVRFHFLSCDIMGAAAETFTAPPGTNPASCSQESTGGICEKTEAAILNVSLCGCSVSALLISDTKPGWAALCVCQNGRLKKQAPACTAPRAAATRWKELSWQWEHLQWYGWNNAGRDKKHIHMHTNVYAHKTNTYRLFTAVNVLCTCCAVYFPAVNSSWIQTLNLELMFWFGRER